jgi:hypothetical protein
MKQKGDGEKELSPDAVAVVSWVADIFYLSVI